MKKTAKLFVLLPLLSLFSCSKGGERLISVAASEIPHAEILVNAVKPLLEERGYELKVTVLDWTIQNDAVYNGDYDANYFQHRPYLQQYDSLSSTYDPSSYTYTKLFPSASVHFEPLRIYEGKKKASEFNASKKSSTYEICNDISNEIRALDLLVASGVIDSYELDESGAPKSLPSNITPIDENLLVASLSDYDYAVLPANSALTGKLEATDSLPVESDSLKDKGANVLAASVSRYKSNGDYKAKIDALTDALLSEEVADYIEKQYLGVLSVAQKDLR